MSLLPSANAIIASQPPNDPLRITLEEMIAGGHVGHANAITLDALLQRLNTRGLTLTGPQWQTTVLKQSRVGNCFIGSGSTGFYIIDTRDDAIVMQAFYLSRIISEMEHLANLRRQVTTQCGWTI